MEGSDPIYRLWKKNVNVDKLIAHMITNGREKSRHFVIYFDVFKNVKKYKAIAWELFQNSFKKPTCSISAYAL